jgi:AcrR family transcriptional regulator
MKEAVTAIAQDRLHQDRLDPAGPAFAPLPYANGRAGKRDRIVGAALRLFAHQPYQEVTMDSVAKEAGVAKGTLYLYFESKEALYLGILSDGLEKAAQSNPVDPQADVVERLRRAITVSIHFYNSHRDFLHLIATEEPRVAAARNRLLEDFRQRGFDFFCALIEEGSASGILRRTDSRIATLTIMGAIRSLLLYYGEPLDAAVLSRELARMILEGLANGTRNSRKSQVK